MSVPSDHAKFLGKHPFPLPPEQWPLTKQEADVLRRYGYWLEALATGHITPTTDQQRHFVAVAHDRVRPESVFENAWIHLRALHFLRKCAIEQDWQGPVPPWEDDDPYERSGSAANWQDIITRAREYEQDYRECTEHEHQEGWFYGND